MYAYDGMIVYIHENLTCKILNIAYPRLLNPLKISLYMYNVMVCVYLWRPVDWYTFVYSLSSPQPAEYAVYKPLLVLFGLVDALQKLLKVRLSQVYCQI